PTRCTPLPKPACLGTCRTQIRTICVRSTEPLFAPLNLFRRQQMQAEQPGRIGPGGMGAPAGASGQPGELIEIVFIRTLGVDGFTFPKDEDLAGDMHRLFTPADQMHLDTALVPVIDGAMAETGEVE